ncbi:anthranilate synthase component I family protein [Hymenobacter sp. RP-2-7]|uniref:Anthranilate synthase component 1 n=1 Tax=Hymenobacter polaris TaxID=2682546 RepID=A0A7Y0FN00_9BACT|nr:anthranilate synthase component I family protein [Hymenobacter polaris]NML66432.1 anthranilate synthase component I family protein [Hymenobacter polaris]
MSAVSSEVSTATLVHSRHRRLLADTLTPVSLYLRLRDQFVGTLLLESSDYHGHDNSFSYLCFSPVARFELDGRQLTVQHPGQPAQVSTLADPRQALGQLRAFRESFRPVAPSGLPFTSNGLFGHMAYEAVQYFEDVTLRDKPAESTVPAIVYQAFRYVIVINHFKDELYLFEHQYLAEGEEPAPDTLDQVETLIQNRNFATHPFRLTGAETTNATDAEYLELVRLGQHHCQRGDVFQIVLSRRFAQEFQGDEFNVYRALRSLNPSPYLFFFDYGSYKLFGSSPESQIVIKQGQAVLYPIAGTFRRTGDDAADAHLAQQLLDDPKETAEHVMLVDLARNDLSRRCDVVAVERFKEIQYYSHVIHLVSKVVGSLGANTEPLDVVGETFPAGTLSGAPKYRAVQLIDEYESTQRGFYGGCLGVLDFGGDFNHAIMIRTFLSQDNTLYFQAGAGVVAKSVPESELQEVHNKLGALRAALQQAEKV